MSLEQLDYTQLARLLDEQKPPSNEDRVLLAQNNSRFTKIAADVWKSHDSAGIWRLQVIDGQEYLVRDEKDKQKKEASAWRAISNRANDEVTLAFRNQPLMRFAAKDCSFDRSNVVLFEEFLLEKIANDDWRARLYASLPIEDLTKLAQRDVDFARDLVSLQQKLAQLSPADQAVNDATQRRNKADQDLAQANQKKQRENESIVKEQERLKTAPAAVPAPSVAPVAGNK